MYVAYSKWVTTLSWLLVLCQVPSGLKGKCSLFNHAHVWSVESKEGMIPSRHCGWGTACTPLISPGAPLWAFFPFYLILLANFRNWLYHWLSPGNLQLLATLGIWLGTCTIGCLGQLESSKQWHLVMCAEWQWHLVMCAEWQWHLVECVEWQWHFVSCVKWQAIPLDQTSHAIPHYCQWPLLAVPRFPLLIVHFSLPLSLFIFFVLLPLTNFSTPYMQRSFALSISPRRICMIVSTSGTLRYARTLAYDPSF